MISLESEHKSLQVCQKQRNIGWSGGGYEYVDKYGVNSLVPNFQSDNDRVELPTLGELPRMDGVCAKVYTLSILSLSEAAFRHVDAH